MARAKPTRIVESDEDDSDSGQLSSAPAKRKAGSEDANPAAKRARTASAKQKQLDKENLDTLQSDVQRAEKALQKKKKAAAAAQAAATAEAAAAFAEAAAREAEYESEDPMEDDEDSNIRIPNRIMALPVIAPPADKPVTLKSIKRATVQRPRTTRFMALPELTREQRVQNARSDDDDDERSGSRSNSPPPRTSSPPLRTSSPPPRTSSPPPIDTDISNEANTRGRHNQGKGKVAAFCEGFVAVAGPKPKASDYAPTEKAQAQWAKESFKAACRAARERFQFTDRIGNIIRQRGPSSRGKIIEKTRSLFASEYKMTRSTSAVQVTANKAESERLLVKAAFHYKDTKKRAGYAENPIIKAVRQLTVFKDTDAVGVIFASAFNPIPFSLIALEMTAIEVCVKEWQTGQFVQSKFTEKAVGTLYSTHLIDVEKWSTVSPTVVENLRRHWYTKLTGTLVNATTTTTGPSNIDDEQEAALRAELEGRTGDTDSEPEAEEEGGGVEST
ncbi:hypothetical protein C8F01DRAFT_1294242 [Mycena amicta]|nr:hypothetical protein C8F01DRAFT_1294242 [Mycena amicta]